MDQYYDVESTKMKISNIASGQIAVESQLSNVDNTIKKKDIWQVASSDGNRTWRLIRALDENNAEEVVLRMQGIICSKTLPPIRFPYRIEARQRNFLRQSVTICGLGSQSFTDSIQSIHEIHGQISHNFNAGSVEEWNSTTFEGHEAVDIANRYFTPRLHTSMEQITPFTRDVDPDGILNGAMILDDTFTHTTDNEVEYYELATDIEGMINYNTVNPIKFRVGDIVEAQVSFVCVPLKNAKYKMLVVLRALTVLDTSPVREASISRNRNKNQIVAQVSLKRKVGYSSDELAEARERMSRMRLD